MNPARRPATEDAGALRRPSAALPAVAVLAAVLHVGASAVAGVLTPGYDAWLQAMSDLGRAGRPHAALMNVAGMILPGLLVAAAALLGSRQLAVSGGARVGLATMLAAGVSLVIAGYVPFPSPVHLAAAIAVAAGCAAATALFAPWAAARLGSRWWCFAGWVAAAMLVIDAMAWVAAEGLKAPLHGAMGIEQRAASYAAFTWWAAALTALWRRDPRTAPPHYWR